MLNKLKNIESNFSLSKAAAIVGFFALLSRLVGFARDMLFASRLGPGDTLDIYYASFRIPDFVFNLLVLGTLSVAFIPVFTEVLIESKERAFKVANTILNASLLIMAGICLVLFVAAEPLTRAVVPGFSGEKFSQTVMLTRLFLLSPLIFTASNIFGSILQSYKKFLLVSLAPILYNFGIIAGLLIFYPRFGLLGWGMGVVLGALMHMLVQVPAAVKQGFSWKPVLDIKDTAVRKIGRLFLPRIFGLDISNVSLFFATIVGSTLASGSISIFNLANNLQAVPLGIFALSVSVASFPVLSELNAKRDREGFMKTLAGSALQILFFVIPISILVLLLRAYIVRLAFGRGQFDWTDTILTFNCLGVFAMSLFSQSLSPLMARAFYSRHVTKIPVYIGLCTMAINATLAFFLGRVYGVVGLAGAFSLASIFDALVLFLALRHHLHKDTGSDLMRKFDSELATSTAKILASSMAMGLATYGVIYLVAPLVNTRTALGILVQSGLAALCGIAVYTAVASALDLPQARQWVKFIKKSSRSVFSAFFNRVHA